MDEPEKVDIPQPTYVAQPGQPVNLVDGLVLEFKDDMVIMSLFKSDSQPHATPDIADSSTPWLSFCQGKYAMTKSTFDLFNELFSQHGSKTEKKDRNNDKPVR